MVALINILNLILCLHNSMAFRPNHGRIVTPVDRQTGGVETNQNFGNMNISFMFSPNNNTNEILPSSLGNTEKAPVTEAVPTINTDTIFGIVFPTNINIFLNITSNNAFGITTNIPSDITSTQIPDVSPETPSNIDQTSSPLTSTTNDSPSEIINIDSSNGQNKNDFGISAGDNTQQQPVEVIQSKMISEEKCEEYYNMGTRKIRTAKVQVFIVGGTNSLPKEFPHMAALGYGKGSKKEWLCGGSLISENYVVTAAHCLSSKTLGDIQFVRLGTTNLQEETLDSADYNVVKKIPHPDYIKEEQYNDIALLQLDPPVKFSDSIAPICLYPTKNVTQKKLIASGWGKTESAGEVSPELQKVELECFPNDECQLSYAVISKRDLPRGIVDDSQICAGSRKEEKDTCQGDSGGPLQFQDNGRMYLVGITSFGIGCGKPGSPGVYTRVSYFIPWIEKIVWGK